MKAKGTKLVKIVVAVVAILVIAASIVCALVYIHNKKNFQNIYAGINHIDPNGHDDGSFFYLSTRTETTDRKYIEFAVDAATKINVDEETTNLTSPSEYVTREWVEENASNLYSSIASVTVTAGRKMDKRDNYILYHANEITIYEIEEVRRLPVYKPIIYLYPEEETSVSVKLDINGELTHTYPKYVDGWKVTAMPDGCLTDEAGMKYQYLFWEANLNASADMNKGFCVKGEDTAIFLEVALDKLGLNRREANEFIIYWLPQMENNPYNLISFQTENYTDKAVLNVNPAPDTVIRVFMAWKALDEPCEIEPQNLQAPTRNGFTLVEWGGGEISDK